MTRPRSRWTHPALTGTLALCLITTLLTLSSAVGATPWAQVQAPAPGSPQVIGGAANGCIGGASVLPEQGPGYISVRRHRNRYYGHPELIRLIRALGTAHAERDGTLMMVGDLSQPRGGRMPSSHRSHQNGLDVDIWLTPVDSPAAARQLTGPSDPPSLVAPGGERVNARWGAPQRRLVEGAARHPAVDRIFVNPAIKRALCESAGGDRGWLRKVRPWWGHDAHMHVRLACPSGSPLCEAQAPVPAGDGCGSELAWWFSEEARRPGKSGQARSEPELLGACLALLPD